MSKLEKLNIDQNDWPRFDRIFKAGKRGSKFKHKSGDVWLSVFKSNGPVPYLEYKGMIIWFPEHVNGALIKIKESQALFSGIKDLSTKHYLAFIKLKPILTKLRPDLWSHLTRR